MIIRNPFAQKALAPPSVDPFTGEPLIAPDDSQQAMIQKLASNASAKVGNTLVISFPSGATTFLPYAVAEYKTPDGFPKMVQVTSDILVPAAATNGCVVIWTITWGHGGASHTRSYIGAFRTYTLSGSFFRLTATIIPGIFPATSAGSATIVGEISSDSVVSGEHLTQWNTNYADPLSQATLQIAEGADRYMLEGDTVTNVPFPCTLNRIEGVNAGSTAVYPMLFDNAGLGTPAFPTNGTVPQMILGLVQPGGTFSWDSNFTGRAFQTQLAIAASSTGGVYTRDSAARLSVNWELLLA